MDREVPIPPGGSFSDYVPFYFTCRTPMLLNIKTGRNIQQRPQSEIVILVSSLHRLKDKGVPFVFTDRHAYLQRAIFSSDLAGLNAIDWEILKKSDFSADPEDPGKGERYQAEALAYKHVPLDALLGMVCYSTTQKALLEGLIEMSGASLKLAERPDWYF